MSFETLVKCYGYWMAVKMTLTLLGVDFRSEKDGEASLAINTPDGRFVVYHNNKGNNEWDVAIRPIGEDETKGAQGIDDTFSFLGEILRLYEGDCSFDLMEDCISDL